MSTKSSAADARVSGFLGGLCGRVICLLLLYCDVVTSLGLMVRRSEVNVNCDVSSFNFCVLVSQELSDESLLFG